MGLGHSRIDTPDQVDFSQVLRLILSYAAGVVGVMMLYKIYEMSKASFTLVGSLIRKKENSPGESEPGTTPTDRGAPIQPDRTEMRRRTMLGQRRNDGMTRDVILGAQADADKWRNQAKQLERALRDAQRGLDEREASRQKLQDQLDQARKKQMTLEEQVEIQRKRAEATEGHAKTLVGQIDQLQKSNEMSTEQWHGALRELQKARVLSESRIEELQGLRTYMTMKDTVSGADLVKAVTELNTEIHQTAARLADAFDIGPQTTVESEDIKRARTLISDLSGANVVRLLHANNSSDDRDPTVVQIALQTMMVAFCYRMVMAWNIDQDRTEEVFHSLENGIKTYELPSVAKRWQVLTRRHLRMLARNDLDIWISKMCAYTREVLVLSRCEPVPSAVESRNHFEGSFGRIASLAMALKKSIMEDFASMDMALLGYPSGMAFNSSKMNDAYKPRQGLSVGPVACTIELGLASIEARKKCREDITWEYEMTQVLLKPSVVLLSAFVEEKVEARGGAI